MVDLNEIAYSCYTTALERAKHVPHLQKSQWLKNLAGEVVELQEAVTRFRLLDSKDSRCSEAYDGIKEEISDVFIYDLILAFDYGIDVQKELKAKMKTNEKRALGIGDKL